VPNGGDHSALLYSIVAFGIAILINFAASYVQETVVGRVAEEVLFDIRLAMFSHLQRVSLSFMDKTEVGRLMSRLQGDVNSMQEFLETSVLSVGDITLLFGIVGVMLYLNFRLGIMTLAVLAVLIVVRIYWLPRARVAFMAAHETNSVTMAHWLKPFMVCGQCKAWTGRASTSRSMTTRPTPI
jgi:ATP-binding cassette subfamily B protein